MGDGNTEERMEQEKKILKGALRYDMSCLPPIHKDEEKKGTCTAEKSYVLTPCPHIHAQNKPPPPPKQDFSQHFITTNESNILF